MTVKQFLRPFPNLEKVTFRYDNGTTEEINCNAPGSYEALKKHYNEEVARVYAMASGEIRIDID